MADSIWSLRAALNRLWADHVIWTREYVVAAIAGTPDAEVAAARLLRNQEDIGGAVVPFYGQAAGEALTGLLKEHIMIAVDLVAAAKAGDDDRFKAEDERWTRNAEAIAELLSGANPHWVEKDITDALLLHLNLTKQEAVARLNQDWQADVEAFDQIFTEILTISDVLANGIVAQFPDRFGE
jgi:hypothetical protein